MMKKKGLIALSIVMFAVLVGQFIYTIYNNAFEPSSYTDWISAFCNIIMAGATVVAVLAAKNYLAQFTAQEGYKKAIEFKNISLHEFVKLFLINKNIGTIQKNITKLHDGKLINTNRINDILLAITEITASRDNIFKAELKLKKELADIGSYGVILTRDKFNQINMIWDFNDELFTILSTLACQVDNVLRDYYIDYYQYDGDRVLRDNAVEILKELNDPFIVEALKQAEKSARQIAVISKGLIDFNSKDSRYIKNYFIHETD
ncbi:hypothetical protein P2W49_12535 [Yersinia intermedia]|nr:hypothetical protein P2W49_12535 [Yersinia intermedia]